MKSIVATALLLYAAGAAPTAQPAWTTTELGGGGSAQFQLTNEDGASLILVCELRGVNAGFEFPSPVDAAERATLRAIPGERQNVAVTPVNDRLFQLTGRGVDTLLRLLRTTANLRVSLSGERAAFEVFGSDSIVSECFQRQARDLKTDGSNEKGRALGARPSLVAAGADGQIPASGPPAAGSACNAVIHIAPGPACPERQPGPDAAPEPGRRPPGAPGSGVVVRGLWDPARTAVTWLPPHRGGRAAARGRIPPHRGAASLKHGVAWRGRESWGCIPPHRGAASLKQRGLQGWLRAGAVRVPPHRGAASLKRARLRDHAEEIARPLTWPGCVAVPSRWRGGLGSVFPRSAKRRLASSTRAS